MREILFRGKRLDNGEWVEGGYRHEKVGDYLTAVFIIQALTSGVWENHRIDPSTVGQFTGLCDKNGKKIFEGDIVKPLRCAPSINSTELVEYDGGGFTPFAMPGWECAIEPRYVTVIGNKWDNPELLEDEE